MSARSHYFLPSARRYSTYLRHQHGRWILFPTQLASFASMLSGNGRWVCCKSRLPRRWYCIKVSKLMSIYLICARKLLPWCTSYVVDRPPMTTNNRPGAEATHIIPQRKGRTRCDDTGNFTARSHPSSFRRWTSCLQRLYHCRGQGKGWFQR